MTTGPALQARDSTAICRRVSGAQSKVPHCCTSTRQIPLGQIPSASSLGPVVDECTQDSLALCCDLWGQMFMEGIRSWRSLPACCELNPHFQPHLSNAPGCPWLVPSPHPRTWRVWVLGWADWGPRKGGWAEQQGNKPPGGPLTPWVLNQNALRCFLSNLS